MASLRTKATSSVYWACFTDADGKKRQRSTGSTNRREAQKIADSYEAAAQRKFTVAHVQRTLRDLMADATGVAMPGSTVTDWLRTWIDRRRVENAASTVRYFEKCARRFQEWASVHLPQGGRTQLAAVMPAHIDAFRLFAAEQVSVATVNHEMKFLRQCFDAARREGMLLESPCATMKPIRRHQPAEARAFTMNEVRALLAVADAEWRSMILFGFYTGQRLGDLARLDWKNFRMDRGEVSFRMAKTGRQMIVPLSIPLITQLANTPVLERLGPLHPHAAAKAAGQGDTHGLSQEFHRLMVRAGLVAPRPHAKRADTGDRRRVRSQVSFHSFRHTATSMLRDAGASPGVAMELIGHASATVHQHYCHLGSDTLRRGISLLPTL